MKEKTEFTKSEAKQIKSLLNELNELKQDTASTSSEQKQIRIKLRGHGFYLQRFKKIRDFKKVKILPLKTLNFLYEMEKLLFQNKQIETS